MCVCQQLDCRIVRASPMHGKFFFHLGKTARGASLAPFFVAGFSVPNSSYDNNSHHAQRDSFCFNCPGRNDHAALCAPEGNGLVLPAQMQETMARQRMLLTKTTLAVHVTQSGKEMGFGWAIAANQSILAIGSGTMPKGIERTTPRQSGLAGI